MHSVGKALWFCWIFSQSCPMTLNEIARTMVNRHSSLRGTRFGPQCIRSLISVKINVSRVEIARIRKTSVKHEQILPVDHVEPRLCGPSRQPTGVTISESRFFSPKASRLSYSNTQTATSLSLGFTGFGSWCRVIHTLIIRVLTLIYAGVHGE